MSTLLIAVLLLEETSRAGNASHIVQHHVQQSYFVEKPAILLR